VQRQGTKRIVVAGLGVVAICMLCYASDTLMSSFAVGFVIRLFYGLGVGLTQAPVTESIMGSLPRNRAGVGSAVNDTTRQTGGALGVAVLGSIFASHFHHVARAVPGLNGADAALARESIGAAQKLATTLPPDQAVAVRTAAHDAFLSSGRVTFTIASMVVIGAMCVAARFLPARAEDRTVQAARVAPARQPA
jgi:MFS family permease